MALSQPVLSFLRPLGPPRQSTFRHFLRFSTVSRLRNEAPSSSSSGAAVPPASPNFPAASRQADIAAAEAATEADNPQPSAPKPTLPSDHLRFPPNASIQSSTLSARPPYHVRRSLNKNLPVYTDYKRGGNLHQTVVRKITGDIPALRDELRKLLKKNDKDVKINDLTKHIVIKGHHKSEVEQFLASKGF